MVLTDSVGNKAKGLARLREEGFPGLPFVSLHARDLLSGHVPDLSALAASLGNPDLYAVRSSSATEDTEETAAAGAFLTLLGIPLSDVPAACLQVAQSLPATDDAHGVVIQAFLAQPSVSGVLFTLHDRYLLNVAPGLCAYVVQGHPVEEISCYPSGRIFQRHVPEVYSGWRWQNGQTQPFSQAHSAFTSNLAKALHRLYQRVQKTYGRPMDLEWSYANGTLYILQARPVTRDWYQEPWLLDNSNLAESYAGTVQPMTASVAQRLYKHVYEDLLAASGVSRKKLDQHSWLFDHLVASYHGRMYYVMNHWYAMMAFLPGYARNKENLERMISARTNSQPFLPESLHPGFWLKISYFPIVLWKLLTFKRVRIAFTQRVRNDFERLAHYPWTSASQVDLRILWRDIETNWLHRWYITVENDTALMTLLGWAEKKFRPDQLQTYLSLETPSVAQLREFHRQAKALCAVVPIFDALKAQDQASFSAALAAQPALASSWDRYLATYGGRFPNELKLEVPSPLDDFALLARTLLHLATQPSPPASLPAPATHLPWGIRKLRQFIYQREELRLLRSTAFGWMRKILLTSGEAYASAGVLDSASDIFWLTLHEWEAGTEGPAGNATTGKRSNSGVPASTNNTGNTSNATNIKTPNWRHIVATRKAEAAAHAEDRYPQAFAAYPGDPAPPWVPESLHANALTGKCVYPGRISGKTLVMPQFEEGPYPEFDLLVARHTDPGWSLLLAQSKGLIVEQGGLLSHASIVARELGIPTLIGVPGATNHLQTGDSLTLDATQGKIFKESP
jgi:phosphohistidine swiveling domain-containing protein